MLFIIFYYVLKNLFYKILSAILFDRSFNRNTTAEVPIECLLFCGLNMLANIAFACY